MTHPDDCMCRVCDPEFQAGLTRDLTAALGGPAEMHPDGCHCGRPACRSHQAAIAARMPPPPDAKLAEAVERGKGVVELDERRVKGIAS